jgi:hypothetical protein
MKKIRLVYLLATIPFLARLCGFPLVDELVIGIFFFVILFGLTVEYSVYSENKVNDKTSQ